MNPTDSNTLLSYADASSACEQAGGWLPSFSNVNEWLAVVNYAEYAKKKKKELLKYIHLLLIEPRAYPEQIVGRLLCG